MSKMLIRDGGLPIEEQLLAWQASGRKYEKWEGEGLSYLRKYQDKVTLGKVIGTMMSRRGWTQVETAFRIGCSPQQLSRWMRDIGWPHARYVLTLTLVFPEFATIFKTIWPTVEDFEEYVDRMGLPSGTNQM